MFINQCFTNFFYLWSDVLFLILVCKYVYKSTMLYPKKSDFKEDDSYMIAKRKFVICFAYLFLFSILLLIFGFLIANNFNLECLIELKEKGGVLLFILGESTWTAIFGIYFIFLSLLFLLLAVNCLLFGKSRFNYYKVISPESKRKRISDFVMKWVYILPLFALGYSLLSFFPLSE